MSPEIIAREGKQRALFIGLLVVLAITTMIAYSPALSQSPLFDESFLMAWLGHCLKCGLTTSDTTAYLLAPAADPRDGLTILGSLYVLIAAMLTGTSYTILRYVQVAIHLTSAILLFASVYRVLAPRETESESKSENKNNSESENERENLPQFDGRAFASAAVAALFFCLFPLAPEAVASLFGLPIQKATACMLAATAILLWLDTFKTTWKKPLLILATLLGMVAPWISLKAAFIFLLPLILLSALRGAKDLGGEAGSRPILISLALIIVSSAPAAYLNFGNEKAIPETIKQLTIEKISMTAESDQKNSFLESGPGANIVAMVLPVNRDIDEKYNKVLRLFYLLLPLPGLVFLAAVLTSGRMRMLGLSTALALLVCSLTCAGAINGQNFYGARWLYPYLPLASLLWALLCVSPLFVESGERQTSTGETTERVIKAGLCVIFILAAGSLFFQRTYRQSLSYKSNGKLWKVIKESITIAGQKQTSPFIIVRNLPHTLSIMPILSPFSPQLIDSQSGLPRTVSLSAGRLKEALRSGKYRGVTLHYEKQFEGFLGTDLNIIDKPFGPVLNAVQIARALKPPIMYYKGAIKLDDKNENLLMESHTRAGPAVCLECYGLSPIDGDFVFVEAKVDVPQAVTGAGQANLEMHWLTNWLGDWEARDRRVITSGPVSDGQYHRYYFPLRTLAWTTSGLPTNLMLGFPGGASVAIRSIGLCREPVPLPEIKVAAVHKQDSNKNYFSHYCFNYPDLDELGLCAVYGHDNGLDINFDVSKVEGAVGSVVEIVPLSEAFRNENSTLPRQDSIKIESQSVKGNLKVPSEQLLHGGLFSVRVFATAADHKTVGHASDSLKCLVDQRL